MIHTLRRVTRLPAPRSAVFPFFADARNLQRITPPELHFRFVTPLPIEMREGALIDYRLRLFGVPFGWGTRIALWQPERCFVDVQVRGPYRLWQHAHHFEEVPGGTEMVDEVRWELPVRPFGELARPIVSRQLGRIFDYREQTIRAIFGAEDAAA